MHSLLFFSLLHVFVYLVYRLSDYDVQAQVDAFYVGRDAGRLVFNSQENISSAYIYSFLPQIAYLRPRRPQRGRQSSLP